MTIANPVMLIILDGWGYAQPAPDNAISQANTPHWDEWWQTRPHTLIDCSGTAVGLPEGQMGNSEVGHMHMGAGRVIEQDYSRINHAIASGDFFHNHVLTDALQTARQTGQNVHVIGLLSPGGVHSHEKHIDALVELAAQSGIQSLSVHAVLDGRDTPPRSAKASIEQLQQKLTTVPQGRLASIVGRYYAMDRDQRWDRIAQAYHMYTAKQAFAHSDNALTGLEMAYERGETDEFVKPTITSADFQPISADDLIIFMNFRSDRARQLTQAFTQDEFTQFSRPIGPCRHFITLTEYASELNVQVAFPPQSLHDTFGECLAKHHLSQLRIAETEKYAHVTFFFNGGREDKFTGEDRILVDSPKVATYDLQPEMAAPMVTERLISALDSQRYDAIICNFANADMVGHTGDINATIRAIECLDDCLYRIYQAADKQGYSMLITADHGNAEHMFNQQSGQAHTAHTTEPVPLLYLGKQAVTLADGGSLIDIAPTLLALLGLPIPSAMQGKALISS
jgi:2,3-bisphosphoglycerate-independent phosphoglycerate mutase